MDPVRRLTTRSGESGKDTSVVETVEPQSSHVALYGIIGWNGWPQLPIEDGDQFTPTSSFPARSETGVRVTVVDMPPGPIMSPHLATGNLPVDGRFVEYRSDGMHRTDSVDVIFVINGHVRLTAEDGTSEVLRPGDCVVQNGRTHSWDNDSDAICRLGFVIFSAEPRV
jgi:mannose-6-phosphate isomerase-like protein (cupin superfamily)